MPRPRPIVFACSGCSFAGRLAYDLAQEIDRRGLAEMSCLAGLGAGFASFRRKLPGRRAWIIDGCPIECARGVFDRNGDRADLHVRLRDLGFSKNRAPEQGVDLGALVERIAALAAANEPQTPARALEGVGAAPARATAPEHAAVGRDPLEREVRIVSASRGGHGDDPRR
ncbi:hypothetical protein PLCT1_01586 [Planctomycetaceae bacterium]|jgi:uncharacterized metal-binding protein|nr:hypothetical protein PLCT1_01586 [Planctomycetaceae bacterium]